MNTTLSTWQLFEQLLKTQVAPNLAPSVAVSAEYPNVSFDALLSLIQEHRLELLLYPQLKNLLPKPWMNSLQARCFNHLNRHQQQQKVLIQLTAALQAEQIPYATFKGITLNHTLHQPACLRYAQDIDLLVKRESIPEAHRILLTHDFQLHARLDPLSLTPWSRRLLGWGKDLVYLHPASGVVIELHHQLTYRGNLGFTPDGDQTQTVLIEGHPITTLNPTFCFLYLCLHGASHHWQRLHWLVDLAYFVQRQTLDFSTLYEQAKIQDALTPLIEAQTLLARWFCIHLPPIPHMPRKHWVKRHLSFSQTLWDPATSRPKTKRHKIRALWLKCFLFTKNRNRIQCLLRKFASKVITRL